MILGLHDRPTAISIATLVLTALSVIGFFQFVRSGHKTAKFLVIPSAVFTALVLTGGVLWTARDERGLDIRDGAIRARLTPTGITAVDYQSWDQRIVVQKSNCTASFDIQSSVGLSQTDAWPLVAGTGETVRGCEKLNIDAVFIPARWRQHA